MLFECYKTLIFLFFDFKPETISILILYSFLNNFISSSFALLLSGTRCKKTSNFDEFLFHKISDLEEFGLALTKKNVSRF